MQHAFDREDDPAAAGRDNVIRPPVGWWRRRRHRRHHGHGRRAWGPGFLADLAARVPETLDLTGPQREAWSRVTMLLAANGGAAERVRDDLDLLAAGGPVPDRTARLETLLATALGLVHQVRPAIDAFYATLTDDQKRAMDTRIERRRHRRRP